MKQDIDVVFIRHSKDELEKNSRFDSEFIEYYCKNSLNIENSLKRSFRNVSVYFSPETLQENISLHKNDIVYSEWKHKGDRNSKTYIPNICERNSISYVGADPYVHILCQDKQLSKLYANEFEIESPRYIRIDIENDLDEERFNYLSSENGIIIKPIYESESAGISDDSIVFGCQEAYEKAVSLFNDIKDSIIIEEFISGDEVNIFFLMKNHNTIIYNEVLISENEPDSKSIITYDEKRQIDQSGSKKRIVKYLDSTTLVKMKQLFICIGKTNLLRIDGKILNNKFQLIELTQSPGLSENGAFHYAFKEYFSTYDEFLKHIVLSSNYCKNENPK